MSSPPSGIVKTHRLVLQTPSSQLHLHVPEALNESHVVIGPKAMRDMIDHFPSTRGKADPQLIWVFDDTEVQVRSFETSLDGKGALDVVSSDLHVNQCNAGAGQLATELTISADEFENYDIFATPISLAFHLREFNVSLSFNDQSSLAGAKIARGYKLTYGINQATIAYAESMEAILEVRFTDPASALYVNVQSDNIESLFAMSTNSVPGAPAPLAAAVPSQARSAGSSGSVQGHATRKRPRAEAMARHRTPAKVVQRVAPAALTRRSPGARLSTPSQPPVVRRSSLAVSQPREEPLFLPGSQMSTADKEALDASGLGDMDADEFHAMMEDEGEEVGLDLSPSDFPAPSVPPPPPPLSPSPAPHLGERGQGQGVDFFEDDIESEMGPTQSDESGKVCPPPYPCHACAQFFSFWVDDRRSDRCLTTETQTQIMEAAVCSFCVYSHPPWSLGHAIAYNASIVLEYNIIGCLHVFSIQTEFAAALASMAKSIPPSPSLMKTTAVPAPVQSIWMILVTITTRF